MTDNEIIPISLKYANEYVTVYHRHHKAVTVCKTPLQLLKSNERGKKMKNIAKGVY